MLFRSCLTHELCVILVIGGHCIPLHLKVYLILGNSHKCTCIISNHHQCTIMAMEIKGWKICTLLVMTPSQHHHHHRTVKLHLSLLLPKRSQLHPKGKGRSSLSMTMNRAKGPHNGCPTQPKNMSHFIFVLVFILAYQQIKFHIATCHK